MKHQCDWSCQEGTMMRLNTRQGEVPGVGQEGKLKVVPKSGL